MGMYILIGLTLFFLALLLMTEYIGRNFGGLPQKSI